MYSLPSGSHTLYSGTINHMPECSPMWVQNYSLGSQCAVEDDRKRMIAIFKMKNDQHPCRIKRT